MSKTKKKLRLKLSENANLLIVSFAIAFVIWVFAKSSQMDEATISVPVTVSPSDPLMEVRIQPSRVPVLLRYPKDMQSYITSENFRFVVDVRDLKTNLGLEWKSKSQPLTVENWVANVPGPGRIELLKIGADSKTVEVKVRWNAQPAIVKADVVDAKQLPPGLQLVQPVHVSPRDVWVAGDADAIEKMPRDPVTSKILLMTDTIRVSDRQQSSFENVPIRIPAGVEIVEPQTAMAEVNLEIQEIQTVRDIPAVRVSLRAINPESVTVQSDSRETTVTVFGPQSLIKQLNSESFEVTMIRPPEELPGTTIDVPIEARFGPRVGEEVRSRVSIRSTDPKVIRVRYATKSTMD